MPSATIGKWGNSQALTIPSNICNAMGLSVGRKANVDYDLKNNCVIYQFDQSSKKYSRSKKMTMEEFAAGWQGAKIGTEWGGYDVGAEVVK